MTPHTYPSHRAVIIIITAIIISIDYCCYSSDQHSKHGNRILRLADTHEKDEEDWFGSFVDWMIMIEFSAACWRRETSWGLVEGSTGECIKVTGRDRTGRTRIDLWLLSSPSGWCNRHCFLSTILEIIYRPKHNHWRRCSSLWANVQGCGHEGQFILGHHLSANGQLTRITK